MTQVIITLKVMPTSPETDLSKLEEETKKLIAGFAGETEIRTSQEPVAFGLKAVKFTFVADEAKGGTDNLESQICSVEGVQSVEVADVRRAIG